MMPGRWFDIKHVVDIWAKEREDYNHELNSCGHGKTCGQYAQVSQSVTLKKCMFVIENFGLRN